MVRLLRKKPMVECTGFILGGSSGGGWVIWPGRLSGLGGSVFLHMGAFWGRSHFLIEECLSFLLWDGVDHGFILIAYTTPVTTTGWCGTEQNVGSFPVDTYCT